jgi:membrane fusion protein (multidrug efflux system)
MGTLSRNLLIAALAGVLAFGAWQLLHDRGKPNEVFMAAEPAVRAVPAERREIADRVEALGTTSSWESIELRPTVTEVVSAIRFTDGQTVARGDVIVELAQQEEAAKLAEARAYLDEQLREVRRIEGLVARRSLPQNQLDERRTLADIARARLQAAEAALADRTIRAPFAGVLGLRNVSPGALVTPETVITTLDDVAALRLDFTVPSTLLERLRTGEEVKAVSPAFGGREFSGTVTGIDSRVNPVDRSVTVRARIDNADRLLKPGMLLTVDLHHDTRNALLVPEEALVHYQRDHFVLVVDRADGNRLERRKVGLGTRIPGSAEIVSGLEEGELIVVEGLTTARPGQQVRLLGAPGADSAP